MGVVTEPNLIRDELLSLLGAEAQRLGKQATSPRALEDWISEGYLDGPSPRGRQRGLNPEWQYTAEAAERAIAVVRLRAKGTKRAAATRIRLFLMGFAVPPHKIKTDLRIEFERLLKRHFFRQPWSYEADKGVKAAEAERQKQLRRAGNVDPVLAEARFKAPDDTILDSGSAVFLGIEGAKGLLPTLSGILDSIPFLTDEFKKGVVQDVRPYADLLGLFGNPEEIEDSGLDSLRKCSDEDIESGRDFYQFVLSLSDTFASLSKLSRSQFGSKVVPALERIAATLHESDEWSIAILVAGSVAAFRRRNGIHNWDQSP